MEVPRELSDSLLAVVLDPDRTDSMLLASLDEARGLIDRCPGLPRWQRERFIGHIVGRSMSGIMGDPSGRGAEWAEEAELWSGLVERLRTVCPKAAALVWVAQWLAFVKYVPDSEKREATAMLDRSFPEGNRTPDPYAVRRKCRGRRTTSTLTIPGME